MDYKKEREQEMKLLERDMIMLAIGGFIIMVLVALTLNVPDKTYPPFDKQCYEICRRIVSEDMDQKPRQFLTTTKFIVGINECMDSCEEEKNENRDKSLAP